MNRSICVAVIAIALLGEISLAGREVTDPKVSGAANADPSLVGWWTFDDVDLRLGLAPDSSGWGRDGILLGAPQFVQGCLGYGVQFDGLEDYVATGYAEDLARWTVCTWVKSPAAPAGGFGSGPVHREANYQLNWNHGNPQFRGAAGVRIGDTWHAASFGELSAETWYHLAATFDGTALNAYVDGVLITSNSAAQGVPFTEPGTLTFGKHARGEYFFAGTIDDVRLYDDALTYEAITQISGAAPRATAWNPQPAHGANVDLREPIVLSWSPVDNAAMYDIYFGADAVVLAAADVNSLLYWGRQVDTSFPLGEPVEFGQCFWRIDEVEADGQTVRQGPVWAFTLVDYFIVDEFESYTDDPGNQIHETWIDGPVNGTGALVGNPVETSVDPIFVHEGTGSMSLDYDNIASPFYSEAGREFDPLQDWTVGDVDTLSLRFRGSPEAVVETSPGIFDVSAAGADIWSIADEFRYVYWQLSGDGAIVARVDSVGHTHPWAKAGVMIRQSLVPGSAHAFMLVTPNGRRVFQNRPINYDGVCYSAHSEPGAISSPHWVKLERKGNEFTAYHSDDGTHWIKQPDDENTDWYVSPNPQTISMPTTVYIGLALTSHVSGVVTASTFSGVETSSTVSRQWQVADIGVVQPANSPDELYVVVEGTDGDITTVVHPDAAAVNALAWTEWEIPLSSLGRTGWNEVQRMGIGVGDRNSPAPNGVGRIYIDDIRLLRSESPVPLRR